MYKIAGVVLGTLFGIAACEAGGEDTPDASHAPPTCPALNGQELEHQEDITSSETWAGDGTVHRVTFGLTIRPGGSLTLAPCAVVEVEPGLVLTVTGTEESPAALISLGTATRPVLITSTAADEKWGGIRGLTATSTFDLSYTVIENGGSNGLRGSALDVRGGGLPEREVVRNLRADHLVIKDAAGTGLVLESAAGFSTDSSELTVTGGGGTIEGGDYAIETGQIAAGTLPTLTVSGNAHDAIRIAGSLFISADLTLKNLGVPYYFVFDRVRVTDPTGVNTPTLTVDPGVELRFDDYLQVGTINPGTSDNPGTLLAIGTAGDPIVFTSSKETPAAGDWPGIHLFNAPGSRLENARIEFAGGFNGIVSSNCKPADSTDAAALFIGSAGGGFIPDAGDFVAVTIASSASHAINAMWTAAAFGPDLTSGFTFEAIGGCSQTNNSRTDGCGEEAGCLVP